MTSTSAVSQAQDTAGEAIGGRAREPGRNGGSGEEGGFPGLLSLLAAGRRPGAEAPASGDRLPPDSRGRRMEGWLGAGGQALEGEGSGDVPETLVSEPDATGELQVVGDVDAAILAAAAQGDASTGAPDRVHGGMPDDAGPGVPAAAAGAGLLVAAIAVAGAAGTAPRGTPHVGQPQPLPPDAVIPPRSSAEESVGAAPPVGQPAGIAVATVAVLRRETHLAPAREAAIVAGRLQAASQPNAHGESRADEPVDTPRTGPGPAGAAPPGAPAPAVTAGRRSDAGAQQRQGREALPGRQPATDARGRSLDVRTDVSARSEEAATVARSEAHASAAPAPSPPPTAVQQMAARIAAEAGTASQSARPQAAGLVPLAQPQLGSAVKVLHIQLQPADLGTVTVRISLEDQALRLDVETGRGDTARLIQREREALSSLLRSAGYLVDGLEVRVADAAAQAQQAAGGQSGMQAPAGGQAGSSQADGRPQGARPHDQRRGNPFANGNNGEDEQAGHPARRGDIYV
jgi:chemotaxis protein MotD